MVKTVFLDLVYFFCSMGIFILLFFILHVGALRTLRIGKGLATILNRMIALSGILMIVITFLIFRNAYSTLSTYIIGSVGALISGVFILGFYGFSSPICADRSPSAHMALVLLEHHATGLSREGLRKEYGYDKVFDRRIADFFDSRIIEDEDETIHLTPKGYRLALYYRFLIRLLSLPKNY